MAFHLILHGVKGAPEKCRSPGQKHSNMKLEDRKFMLRIRVLAQILEKKAQIRRTHGTFLPVYSYISCCALIMCPLRIMPYNKKKKK